MDNKIDPMRVFIDSEPEYGRYKIYVYRRSGEMLWLLDCVGDKMWQKLPHPNESVDSEDKEQPSFWLPWDCMQALFDAITAKGFKPKTLEGELAATQRHLADALQVRDRILGLWELRPATQIVEDKDD